MQTKPYGLVPALMMTLLSFSIPASAAEIPFRIQDSAGHWITCDLNGLAIPPSPVREEIIGSSRENSTAMSIAPSFGGVGTSLVLNGGRGESINIIEGHSAGGAGWQTSFFGLDPSTNHIYVFNQGAGNSDQQWGVEGSMVGLSHSQWIPLYSDHYHDGPTFEAPSIGTSPCPRLNNALFVSQGRNQFLTSTRAMPNGSILPSIENRFTMMARAPQKWSWWQAEQAMYLGLKEAVQNDLRVVFIGKEKAWTKVIQPTTYEGFTSDSFQQGGCKTAKNCWLHSADVDSIVLIYNVGGEEMAVGIRRPNALPFQVELNIQDSPYGCPELGNPVCGNVNVHFWQAPDAFKPEPLVLAAGETRVYAMTYVVGRLSDVLSDSFFRQP